MDMILCQEDGMPERDRELRRRRARRLKTRYLKARIQATTDARLKARLIQKLKRVNPFASVAAPDKPA